MYFFRICLGVFGVVIKGIVGIFRVLENVSAMIRVELREFCISSSFRFSSSGGRGS